MNREVHKSSNFTFTYVSNILDILALFTMISLMQCEIAGNQSLETSDTFELLNINLLSFYLEF